MIESTATAEEGTAAPEEMPPELKLYRKKGLVKEQWQTTGTRIEYVKSRLERGGWTTPGPLNMEDEEDDNVD